MPQPAAFKLSVLASGTGSNLQALIDRVHGRDGIEIVAVASDKPAPPAFERARAAGIASRSFPAADFAGDRVARDRAMADWLAAREVRLVVMAGYMQLLTPVFLATFPEAVINVHPALLPAFPGLDAVGQALAYGVKVFGVTVHFVDEGIDSGPIILQRALELPQATTPADVLPHVHAVEHDLLPEAVRLIARGAVRIDPSDSRRVRVRHDR